jgi:hypothetical protein
MRFLRATRRGVIRAPAVRLLVAFAAFFVASGAAPAFAAGAPIQLVPDPNFEANCAGDPCNWTQAFSSLSRDTTLAKFGVGEREGDGDGGGGSAGRCRRLLHRGRRWE